VSDASDAANVNIVLADYVSGDPSTRKLNIIGAGLTVIGLVPPTVPGLPGVMTAPFGVAVTVSVPPELYGSGASLEVLLEDAQGALVTLPQNDGEVAQPLRLGQALTFEEPLFPGWNVPRGTMQARAQWALMFGSGLPLAAGQQYRWRVRIDGETREHWTEPFFVPVQQAGVVFG
jgi:hypothetical protein